MALAHGASSAWSAPPHSLLIGSQVSAEMQLLQEAFQDCLDQIRSLGCLCSWTLHSSFVALDTFEIH